MKRSAVCCIIVDDEILLLERPPKDRTMTGWCLPGGKIESGETEIDGAIRETLEETGITIKAPKYAGDYISAKKHNIVSVYFKVLDKKPEVTISDEHLSYQWVKPKDLNNYDLAGNTAMFIKAIVSNLK
jgi:8-oxo-dGTP diphosphatase